MIIEKIKKKKFENTIAGQNVKKITSKTTRNNLLLQLNKTESLSFNKKKLNRFNIQTELTSLANC